MASKYGNKKTQVGEYLFDSKREAHRYQELQFELLAGAISGLELQREYRLMVNGSLVCKYRADFVYLRDGVQVVEDSKGCRTNVFVIKKKLMKAVFGIEILET